MLPFKVYLKYKKYVTYPRSNKCKEYPALCCCWTDGGGGGGRLATWTGYCHCQGIEFAWLQFPVLSWHGWAWLGLSQPLLVDTEQWLQAPISDSIQSLLNCQQLGLGPLQEIEMQWMKPSFDQMHKLSMLEVMLMNVHLFQRRCWDCCQKRKLRNAVPLMSPTAKGWH